MTEIASGINPPLKIKDQPRSVVSIDSNPTPNDPMPQGAGGPPQKTPKEVEQEQREKAQYEAQLRQTVEYAAPYLETIIGSSELEMRVDGGKRTYFAHEGKPTAVLGAGMAKEMDFTENETVYALGHEGIHFRQFLEDPETYKSTWAIAEDKSKAYGPQKQQAIKQMWNRFFNIQLDMDDNAKVNQRSGAFGEGRHLEDVPKDLYKNKLFPMKLMEEYAANPKSAHSMQFMDALLRKTMVPDEDVPAAPDVKQILEEPLMFRGIQYASMYDFARREIFNPATTLKEWMFYTRNVMMPRFEKLLDEDVKQDRMEMPQKGGGADEGMDPMDPDNFKDIGDYVDNKNKSSSQRSEEQRKKEFEKEMGGKGYSEDEVKSMWERQQRTEDVAQGMKDWWWELVQRSIEYEMTVIEGFKTGDEMNEDLVQEQLPVILTNPSNAEIFNREIEEPARETVKPKKLVVILSEDLSGSMFPDKVEKVRDSKYAVGRSLCLFANEAKIQNPDFPMEVIFIDIGFGDNAAVVYNRKVSDDPIKAERDLWDAVIAKFKVGNSDASTECLGGTQNDAALELAMEELKKLGLWDDEEALILFTEVTDGETSDWQKSAELIAEMRKHKIRAKAIKIGEGGRDTPLDPNNPEDLKIIQNPPPPSNTFERMWGKDGLRLKDVSGLKETFKNLYKDDILDIQQQV